VTWVLIKGEEIVLNRFSFISKSKFFLLVFLLNFSFMTFAQDTWKRPTIHRRDVNGYDLFIINTHNGNGLAVTFNVLAGSLHDEPKQFAGRAHLWEHVIHLGSKKYPGKKTFDIKTTEMGAYRLSSKLFMVQARKRRPLEFSPR